jgi:ubiquinone/menaquinone biosynthesis C-methylase UbiE
MSSQFEISRVTRSKQQAICVYARLSRWYDWFSEGSDWPMTLLGLNKLNVEVGESILEIGFGTGNALLVLAEVVGVSGKVVGIDISRGMFDVAREKVAHASLSPRVTLGQGDAAALPFQENSFDAVFSSFTLELFDTPEIPAVLAECRRVLKPGGRMGVVALARGPYKEFPVRIYEWFHQHLPAYVDCRPIYVQSALAKAGFQVQNVTRKKCGGFRWKFALRK